MNSEPIEKVLLQDGDVRVQVLSIGCVVQSWEVAGVPVVLGYADPEHYRSNPYVMGMVIGRVANRIRGASFTLHGQRYVLPSNHGSHHIHGGDRGLGWRVWQTEVIDERSVRFRLHSPHLEQGYPGNVQFDVLMRLTGKCLQYEMRAVPDRVTPINMAQHHYFNLKGMGGIRDHALQIAARRYTPNDAEDLPLGTVESVEGSAYDFVQSRRIDVADPSAAGHDASLVIDQPESERPVAELTAPNGMRLRMWTDQPCVQLYTAGGLGVHAVPAAGPVHQRFAGLCLEAQGYPDAMANPNFDSILCSPEQPYLQRTRIEIARQ